MGYNRQKVIDIALAEVGYLEKETNKNLDSKTGNAGDENYTKYARDLFAAGYYNGNKNGYAWCDVFVDWCFYKAFGKANGQKLQCQNGTLGASCTYSSRYYKNSGQFYTSNPQPGDQIFFGSGDSMTHTGLVYKVDNFKVYTIEGNTSGTAGVVPNGGGVFKKSYVLTHNKIRGYGRPKYDDGYNVKPEQKEEYLTEDGLWGVATTKKAQKVFGTTVDGEVSNQHQAYQASNPGLLDSTFDWKRKPAVGGSPLIKAIQKLVGVKQDGYIGPGTIKAMQKYFGTPVDGVVSKPSTMIKAFQKWLNAQ